MSASPGGGSGRDLSFRRLPGQSPYDLPTLGATFLATPRPTTPTSSDLSMVDATGPTRPSPAPFATSDFRYPTRSVASRSAIHIRSNV